MEEKVTCAERIREGLSARGLTQADLCRLTGIKKSAMSQYVNGGLVPRQDRTFLIAEALNVSEAWLMGFDVPMDRQKSDPLDEQFLSLFNSLGDREKSLALAMLETLVKSKGTG